MHLVHHQCFGGSTAAFYPKSTVIGVGHRLRTDFQCMMDDEFYARLDAAGLCFEHVPVTVAGFHLNKPAIILSITKSHLTDFEKSLDELD